MIGDGTDDWDSASVTGCRFIGVPDGTLGSAAFDGSFLGDFDNLWLHLQNGSDDD